MTSLRFRLPHRALCAVLFATFLLPAAMVQVAAPARADMRKAGEYWIKGEYGLAYAHYLPYAQSGTVSAQLAVAEILYNGLDGKRDPKAAMAWYRRAADQGNARAMYVIARELIGGKHLKKDIGQGLKMLYAAAKRGSPKAQGQLCYYVLKTSDLEKHLGQKLQEHETYWCLSAANHGVALAMYLLGEYFGYGSEPVDSKRALIWAYRAKRFEDAPLIDAMIKTLERDVTGRRARRKARAEAEKWRPAYTY